MRVMICLQFSKYVKNNKKQYEKDNNNMSKNVSSLSLMVECDIDL